MIMCNGCVDQFPYSLRISPDPRGHKAVCRMMPRWWSCDPSRRASNILATSVPISSIAGGRDRRIIADQRDSPMAMSDELRSCFARAINVIDDHIIGGEIAWNAIDDDDRKACRHL